jgi:hypothetical protein
LDIGDIGRLIAPHYPQLKVTEAANSDGRDYRVDFSRIEALGFRCQVSLGEGIREIGDYVRKHRPDLSESRYNNGLATKEKLQTLLRGDQTAYTLPRCEPVGHERIYDFDEAVRT